MNNAERIPNLTSGLEVTLDGHENWSVYRDSGRWWVFREGYSARELVEDARRSARLLEEQGFWAA